MIQRILVANRGEIARRIFRTCDRLGIGTVAVFSDADADEPHAKEADISLSLPGNPAGETYLNGGAILKAANESRADAIHPGYGFLAENADFARSVLAAGLIWIGPSPEAITIMGSKLESKALMESSDIAILPGVDLTGLSPREAAEAAEQIGYPVLVKASAGGGGKGMRVVPGHSELESSIDAARRESGSAFGDETVFIEKYLDSPRHIEVQIFGDTHGSLISLFERECSIQRRHQKIIEESPSPAVDTGLRRAMSEAAITAGRAVEYTGAGTVEFLLQDASFYFLEMNTRIQVEHPVTEMVTGMDLVELQILVANEERLPESAHRAGLSGHGVEARLYAEDPANGYLPVTGPIHTFDFSAHPEVRVDSGVESGSSVSVHYDPMLAKVIAHGPDRDSAVAMLARALRGARIHASMTNRDLLVRILEHPQFVAGETNTHFLDSPYFEELAAPLADEADEAQAARAAALSDQALDRSQAAVLGTLPSGWRNLPGAPGHRSFRGHHSEHHVGYEINGDHVVFEGEFEALVHECSPHRVVLEQYGTTHDFEIARFGAVRHVDSATVPVRLVEISRFPSHSAEESEGSLHSPMPGRIVRVDVKVGDRVDGGQALMMLEAMKMEHSINAPYSGTVTRLPYATDDQVEAGAILAVVEPSAG